MRKLRKVEEQEIERLEQLKHLYIGEMMGQCNLINECIKEVKSGSWYQRMQKYSKMMELENNNVAKDND